MYLGKGREGLLSLLELSRHLGFNEALGKTLGNRGLLDLVPEKQFISTGEPFSCLSPGVEGRGEGLLSPLVLCQGNQGGRNN